jgi:prepilin-type N-terminal cleavage/methylation domain-containing protein/prepilin-type processing-associated H-X9-DG protein
MKTSQQREAFTLIELLVVIVIISILAAILFPVFARARENARRASCMSNLKQIGLAIMQYTQDYDEKFPIAWRTKSIKLPYNNFTSSYVTWVDQIYPYVNNLQVFQCPSQSFSPNGGSSPAMMHVVTPFAYNYNQHKAETTATGSAAAVGDTGFSFLPATGTGTSLAAVEDPSGTIIVFDGWGSMDSGGWYAKDLASLINGITPTPSPSPLGISTYIKLARRHMDGMNVLYSDGHVKWKNRSTAGEWTLTDAD